MLAGAAFNGRTLNLLEGVPASVPMAYKHFVSCIEHVFVIAMGVLSS